MNAKRPHHHFYKGFQLSVHSREKETRSTSSTQEFLPGAMDKGTQTLCPKAAGTLPAFGALNLSTEGNETGVHCHWNKSPMSSKQTGDSWSMPPALSHSNNQLLLFSGTSQSTSSSTPLSVISSLCFWALHSLMWQLSQLPSCLPTLFFASWQVRSQHGMWLMWSYTGLAGS